MDVSRAQVSNLGSEVELADPGWPWTVRARISHVDGAPRLVCLTVEGSDNGPPITSAALSRIPVRQLTTVVADLMAGKGEAQYRMLAVPRPPGVRAWPADHWPRVAMVVRWALETGRSPAGVVADIWGIHPRTARRWLSTMGQQPGAGRP